MIYAFQNFAGQFHLIIFLASCYGYFRTGKTQTAVNIAGCELQNGSSILVTSVNPQSLAAFVEKLPDDIRKFCIDMAEVERDDGGMSKLCQKCDCMKFDFNELAQKSNVYEQNVKVST